MIQVDQLYTHDVELWADVWIGCDTCGRYEKNEDELFFNDGDIERQVMLDIKLEGSLSYGWNFISNKVVCDDCCSTLCLEKHSMDEHYCMLPLNHGGDHECCKKHMYY